MQLSPLKTTLLSFTIVAMLSLLSGCQCTSLTEVYSDKIDDISDYGFCMDCYYNPCWDLSRIGHSDWKACKMNREWCSDCRDQSCGEECPGCNSCSQTIDE
ncbi:MAG: hypothetical protein P8M30_00395 [Planctomycetaceae bacterium]|nr:hypothetical protein [Planctomycetaceae bacterium]